MPKQATTDKKSIRTSASVADGPNAIVLLKADHAEVKKCFLAYEQLVDKDAGDTDKELDRAAVPTVPQGEKSRHGRARDRPGTGCMQTGNDDRWCREREAGRFLIQTRVLSACNSPSRLVRQTASRMSYGQGTSRVENWTMRVATVLVLFVCLLAGCPQRVPAPAPKTSHAGASEPDRVAQLHKVLARVGLVNAPVGKVLQSQR